MHIDIEYLLFLQEMRMATGGFFNDDQVVGWALHYYHESNEDIEAEFKPKTKTSKMPDVKMKTERKATVQLDDNTEILFDLF